MQEPLNTLPIQQFIKSVKDADTKRAKELSLDMQNAKRLAFTLGEVMARMHGDLEKFVKENASGTDEVIEVNIGSKDSGW